jgi:hypothetical protein
MVEVKNAICGPLSRIPSFCNCAPSGAIGASVTCSVGIPFSGGLTIGASAHFLPCGSPASMGYRAWIGSRELASRTWQAQFNMNIPLPAPPAGFRLGIASLTTQAELAGVVSRGRIQASVALGACGSIAFVGSCCNSDCPLMSRRVDGVPLLPVRLLSGSYDFSRFC